MKKAVRNFYDRFLPELTAADDERVVFLLTSTSRTTKNKADTSITILDVGCGTGRITTLLSQISPRILAVGCDISRECIQRAKQRSRERGSTSADFVVAVAEQLPFANGKAQIVVSSEVLEHIQEEERDRFAKELARVLDKEGSLLLTTPNVLNIGMIPRIVRMRLSKRQSVSEQLYDRPMTPQRLGNLLKAAGLRVDSRLGGTLPFQSHLKALTLLRQPFWFLGLYQFVKASHDKS